MSDIVTIQGFSGKKWHPVDEARLELTAQWFCIQLYTLLVRRLMETPELTREIPKALEFLHSATDEKFAMAAPDLMAQTSTILSLCQKFARPKVSWQKLGDDVQWLLRERKNDLQERGIPLGWIAQRFHMPAFALDEHALWHGRVGVGRNADYTSYDEMHLLSDMIYFLVVGRATVAQLDEAKDNFERLRNHNDHYQTITGVKSNVCALARQSLVASCAFVESFVNGLGLDHLERNPGLSDKHKQFLSGRENGRWVSLDRRLEGFPQVIQGAPAPLYCVCDRTRRDEPFKSFFEVAVDVRDGAMHAGKGKATIWLGPYEWIDLAEKATDSALQVARVLWSHCKVGIPMPEGLWKLDSTRLKEHAQNRIDARSRLEEMLQMVALTEAE